MDVQCIRRDIQIAVAALLQAEEELEEEDNEQNITCMPAQP
jgi:hypothetical protein